MICKVNEQPFSLGEFTVSTKLHLLLFCVFHKMHGHFLEKISNNKKNLIQQNPLYREPFSTFSRLPKRILLQ